MEGGGTTLDLRAVSMRRMTLWRSDHPGHPSPPPPDPRPPVSATRLSYVRIRLNPSTGRMQGNKDKVPREMAKPNQEAPRGGAEPRRPPPPPSGLVAPTVPPPSTSLPHPSPWLTLTGYMIREGPNAVLIIGCSSITHRQQQPKIKELNKKIKK